VKDKLKILLLAGNTLRARAYSQYLEFIDESDFEIQGLFYGFDEKECIIPSLNDKTKEYFNNEKLFLPDFTENIETTFKNNNWHFDKVNDVDVNSENVLNGLAKIKSDIVVFAGYGGQLLKEKHFESGSYYLHMHPGNLPTERGSTTIYYSILNQRKITVTAFYMTKSIDAGENILFSVYPVPDKGVDIDLWLDNVVRADCFIKALKAIDKSEKFSVSVSESEEYYVIHPVLKHIALLSLK
jgi:methionyl-tRNA formyltransferase